MLEVQLGTRRELMTMAARTAHQGRAPLTRAAVMARSAMGGIAEFRKWAASHCDVAWLLGARMGSPSRSSSRCGTCTSAGTVRACRATCAASRSRWLSG